MGWYLLVPRDILEVPVPLTVFAQVHLGADVRRMEGTTPLASPVAQESSRKASPAPGMPWAA